jgi:hypothetical protein
MNWRRIEWWRDYRSTPNKDNRFFANIFQQYQRGFDDQTFRNVQELRELGQLSCGVCNTNLANFSLDYDIYQVTLPYLAEWAAPRGSIDEAHLKPRTVGLCGCCGTYAATDGHLTIAYLCPLDARRSFVELLESIGYVVCFDSDTFPQFAARILVHKLRMVMANGSVLQP